MPKTLSFNVGSQCDQTLQANNTINALPRDGAAALVLAMIVHFADVGG
jgi:hypothetical protein